MKELFDWVPWFGELADKVLEGGPEGLAARAKQVDWAGGKCAVLEEGEENVDPLTFFYHLARISKENRRERTYASVADVFAIESGIDYSEHDCFIFPTPPGFKVRFTGTGADPRLLWRMFRQARDLDAAASDAAIADTFADTLRINGVGVAMLTQALFLVNPKTFLPFDKNAVVPLGIDGVDKTLLRKSLSWTRYLDAMGKVRATFPGCECYEINVISFFGRVVTCRGRAIAGIGSAWIPRTSGGTSAGTTGSVAPSRESGPRPPDTPPRRQPAIRRASQGWATWF